MHVTIVHVHVKKAYVEQFIIASQLNHEASIQEAGNCRFDVLQSPENPCWFILYEAYESKQHAAEHKNTAHYLKWRETVTEWMEIPRKGLPFNGLFPNYNE